MTTAPVLSLGPGGDFVREFTPDPAQPGRLVSSRDEEIRSHRSKLDAPGAEFQSVSLRLARLEAQDAEVVR